MNSPSSNSSSSQYESETDLLNAEAGSDPSDAIITTRSNLSRWTWLALTWIPLLLFAFLPYHPLIHPFENMVLWNWKLDCANNDLVEICFRKNIVLRASVAEGIFFLLMTAFSAGVLKSKAVQILVYSALFGIWVFILPLQSTFLHFVVNVCCFFSAKFLILQVFAFMDLAKRANDLTLGSRVGAVIHYFVGVLSIVGSALILGLLFYRTATANHSSGMKAVEYFVISFTIFLFGLMALASGILNSSTLKVRRRAGEFGSFFMCSIMFLYLTHLLYVALSNMPGFSDAGLHLKTALGLAIFMTIFLTWSLENPQHKELNHLEDSLIYGYSDESGEKLIIKSDIASDLAQSNGYFPFNLFFVVMFASMLLTDFGSGLSTASSAHGAGKSGMFMIIVFQWGSAFFFYWKLIMPGIVPHRRDVSIARGVCAFDLWAPAAKYYAVMQ